MKHVGNLQNKRIADPPSLALATSIALPIIQPRADLLSNSHVTDIGSNYFNNSDADCM